MSVCGVYAFTWHGGSFEVELRPTGEFWCRRFPADARWQLDPTDANKLTIQWRQFGDYLLDYKQEEQLFRGSVIGKPDAWRTAQLLRPFTPQEELLSASAWSLSHEGGKSFRVEFHADGHFHAEDYPGHHLWKLEGSAVQIIWGKYGNYDLTLDVEARQLSGHLRNSPASWRRLDYIERLPAYIFKENSCGHSH